MATIVPNALPHTALEDIQVNGYVIPKVSLESIILQKKKKLSRQSHQSLHSRQSCPTNVLDSSLFSLHRVH